MATYAAYRHVELDKVGCGKRSIMKPPGGDCHDIFGADFHGTPSHHRVLKPPGGGTSGLFSTTVEEADKPRVNVSPSASSTQSIPSSVNSEAKTNGVNGKSGNESVPAFGGSPTGDTAKGDNLTVRPSALSAEIKHLSAQEEKNRRDGNPVTGEGYDHPEAPPLAPQRARIPPGGYSSGLW